MVTVMLLFASFYTRQNVKKYPKFCRTLLSILTNLNYSPRLSSTFFGIVPIPPSMIRVIIISIFCGCFFFFVVPQ